MTSFPSLFIIFLAFAGFTISFYLAHKKRTRESFICPMKARCDLVVNSDYSRFFGIPLEAMGLSYYGLIAIGYAFLLMHPSLEQTHFAFLLLILSTLAFFFSLYLTAIQAFAIKHACTWCLSSATISTAIFLVSLLSTHLPLVSILQEFHLPLTTIHLIGLSLGLGGATINDLFFFLFLKDLRISEEESTVLKMLSQVIWFSLSLIVLSGMGLFFPAIATGTLSSSSLLELIVILVIILNGVALNILIAPKLIKISFGKRHEHQEGELHHIRKLAFALGSVSIVSWYATFILATVPTQLTPFSSLLLGYIFLIAVGICISQLIERKIGRIEEN